VIGVRIQLRERKRGIVIAVEMNWARRRKGITLEKRKLLVCAMLIQIEEREFGGGHN